MNERTTWGGRPTWAEDMQGVNAPRFMTSDDFAAAVVEDLKEAIASGATELGWNHTFAAMRQTGLK